MLLTRTPLGAGLLPRPVRLACIRHAAGVYPEPGSNSQSQASTRAGMLPTSESFLYVMEITVRLPQNLWNDEFLRCFGWSSRSVFKERSYLLLFRGAGKNISRSRLVVNTFLKIYHILIFPSVGIIVFLAEDNAINEIDMAFMQDFGNVSCHIIIGSTRFC